MIRIIINVVLVIIILLVTLFGLGPAFFADGTGTERMYTLLTVAFIYILLFAVMYYVNKRVKKR